MKERCCDPKNKRFADYGGRGIKVCDRWLNSFENFLADMGLKPSPEHSIERKNTDGDYEPDNCKWATQIEQANNKRTNHLITANGKTQTVRQWERELGCYKRSVSNRILRGWDEVRAVTEPFKTKAND